MCSYLIGLNLTFQLFPDTFWFPKGFTVFTFWLRTFCENFSPNGPKFSPYITSFRPKTHRSAQNCYIAYLLFDYAHCVQISVRTDTNSKGGIYRCFRAGLSGLGWRWLFSAQNCYIAYLVFDYAHSLKFSARTGQNYQSGLYGRFRTFLGGLGWRWLFFGPKLSHCLFSFWLRTFCEIFSPNGLKFHN